MTQSLFTTRASVVPARHRRNVARRALPSLPFLTKKKASTALSDVLDAIEGTDRGLATTKEQRKQIEDAVQQLYDEAQGKKTNGKDLSATWKLLWTSEKETLWILKNAGLFGTEAGEVYQVIDMANGSLNNVITFPPEGAFTVDSSVAAKDDVRVEFKFSGARVRTPGRTLPLPPFGQGWFDNIYLDGKYRVAKDSRGDILVTVRDGPPREL
ncbi:unnamed protein product [Pedinophyceae sp. YPF-701]|nr:unnamed protein product [Pedinophyceae sp. YPF-701]